MRPSRLALLCLSLCIACAPVAAQPEVTSVESGVHGLRELPSAVHGRVERGAEGLARQWPGTYFETAFTGRSAYFRLGQGEVIAHVLADGKVLRTLVRPPAATYRVDGLAPGAHRLRIEIASEDQDSASVFGGFYADRTATALPLPQRRRQIEFIGDSYTVGYGNQSATRDCTEERVWETTDTSAAFGPLLAKRYGADYQVNAISGRGVVRSYGGANVDSLPEAYPFILFDRKQPYADTSWRPPLIVIGLGTNDFSTDLHAGEKWRSRAALRADFEAAYVRFVQQLRRSNPRASFILWAAGPADGEVASETRRVVERLQSEGDRRIAFVEIDGLAFTGCNHHPSLADDRIIADRLASAIAARFPVELDGR